MQKYSTLSQPLIGGSAPIPPETPNTPLSSPTISGSAGGGQQQKRLLLNDVSTVTLDDNVTPRLCISRNFHPVIKQRGRGNDDDDDDGGDDGDGWC